MKIPVLLLTKAISFILRRMGRGGSFPGQIALKLNQNIFDCFRYTCPIIVVTGTNGKTSTSNMIADLFTASDQKIINNRKGDNLKEGIATAFINAASISGKIDADAMVLEVDELNIPYIMKHVKVSTLVLTNFFRDQLDRSQEMEQLIQKIEAAVKDFKGTLVLNGNDPNVVRVKDHAPNASVLYFGVERCEASSSTPQEASEGKFCPRCNHMLTYSFYQYSHIGMFQCTNCEYCTPKLDVCGEDITIEQGSFRYENTLFHAPIASLYTIYNCMAVITVAKLYQLPYDLCERIFLHTKQPAGRNETFAWQGNDYTLNLVKNPTGANEVLKTIELDKDEKALMIVLNDNAQDGTDVSWIYDAQFERVLQLSTQRIICSGTRAYDMALRIKYADYPGEIIVIEDPKKALDTLYDYHIRSYIIATYTALAPVRALMRKDEAHAA